MQARVYDVVIYTLLGRIIYHPDTLVVPHLWSSAADVWCGVAEDDEFRLGRLFTGDSGQAATAVSPGSQLSCTIFLKFSTTVTLALTRR